MVQQRNDKAENMDLFYFNFGFGFMDSLLLGDNSIIYC